MHDKRVTMRRKRLPSGPGMTHKMEWIRLRAGIWVWHEFRLTGVSFCARQSAASAYGSQRPIMPISAQHLKAARLHIQKDDSTMKRIVKAVEPCTLKTKSDRFMTLVDSILSQQISGAAARTIHGNLVNAVLPNKICPEALVGFEVDQFRSLGISRQKAGYILDLAGKVHEGDVNLKVVSRLDNEGVVVELTKIKGIGPWTAQMFLMFCLGRLDVFPVDDLGIQNAIKRHYKPRGEFNRNRMEKIAQPWRPYATIASWYLWRSLEVEI